MVTLRTEAYVHKTKINPPSPDRAKQPSSLLEATDPHINFLSECVLYSPSGLYFCMFHWCQINTVSDAQLYLPAAQKLLVDIAYETCTV